LKARLKVPGKKEEKKKNKIKSQFPFSDKMLVFGSNTNHSPLFSFVYKILSATSANY
jgi:hypothetical protein